MNKTKKNIDANRWRCFAGKDSWHFQVENENANGVHLIRILKTTDLGTARERLREDLTSLDAAHTSLSNKARDAEMRTLAELEIFPNRNQAFRLPLCRGRTMLLDQPLDLVEIPRTKRRMVQNVERYVDWLAK